MVVLQMKDDIEGMEMTLSVDCGEGQTMWECWSNNIDKIKGLQRELMFWEQKQLCTKYFTAAKVEEEREKNTQYLEHEIDHLVYCMESEFAAYCIPKCLFIVHMQVAEEALRTIFEHKHEHLVCMILTHLYLMENPGLHIIHLVSKEKRIALWGEL